MNSDLSWELMGSLDSPSLKADGGVYLLVFNGRPKRVIYVGTTTSFNRRTEQHRIGMLTGKRTVWRSGKDNDIYEIMSYSGEGNSYKYYHSLAKKGLLWASTTINKDSASNDLVKNDSFDENWKEFVHNHYIKNIEVWVLRTDYSEETNKRIESQIQIALKNKYRIGSHIHKINSNEMCWLGKIEYTDEVFSTSYNFLNAPDVSEEFQKILHNLKNHSYNTYHKPHKIREAAEKAKKLKTVRENYRYSKTSWKREELDFLRKCVRLEVPVDIIAESLERTPEEVIQRIAYQKKYNQF